MISSYLDDTILDANVQFPHSGKNSWTAPRRILLTGSTGFLGIYLLRELLHQTNADISCLIRAADPESGLQRIEKQMRFYHLWEDGFSARIFPLLGDLSYPYLGITKERFIALAEVIDVIYHSGARVNAIYPYARLRPTNVGGTIELLRLAGISRSIPINFLSTLAIFFTEHYQDQTITEDISPEKGANLLGGYKQSKWVAETLMRTAHERGLPIVIHRCGRILGDSHFGMPPPTTDLLITVIQGCLRLGQFPLIDTEINFAPVDYVSKAIIYLGQQSTSIGKNFHLMSPQSINWNSLWTLINSLGYEITGVPFTHWQQAISQRAKSHAEPEFRTLDYLLRSPIYLFSRKPHFTQDQTALHLATANYSCPDITDLIPVYLLRFP